MTSESHLLGHPRSLPKEVMSTLLQVSTMTANASIQMLSHLRLEKRELKSLEKEWDLAPMSLIELMHRLSQRCLTLTWAAHQQDRSLLLKVVTSMLLLASTMMVNALTPMSSLSRSERNVQKGLRKAWDRVLMSLIELME